ncbi:MAG: hypothetical protein P8J20_12530 [Novosphingobium sp.]|nr:hypothetical protein [Novosphingobium sp.]
MRALTTRFASLFALALCGVLASPAQASLNDQFPCQSDDHTSLLVYFSAFDSNKAVLQVLKENDDNAHIHELTLKPGGGWEDFRYEDKHHHSFVGGNGKGVLLMHGKAYFCEFAGDPGEGEEAAEAAMHPGVLLDGRGLENPAKDTVRTKLRFGDSRDALVAALSLALGPPGEEMRNEECGAGPMRFLSFGPLTANFQEGAWVGWILQPDERGGDAVPITLADGAVVGSRLADLPGQPEYYEDSTLGDEFMIGGISGISTGRGSNAKIDTLWAGTNCLFR